MFSSNQFFKVSGEGKENLQQTIELLYKLNSMSCSDYLPAPESYKITNRGIIFYKYSSKGDKFIVPPSSESLTLMINDFLNQFDYDNTLFLNEDNFYDGDGSHRKGWIITNNIKDFTERDYDIYFAVYAHWRYYSK